MVKYEFKNGCFLKDGHTMFHEDVLKDLKRKAYLEVNKVKKNEVKELKNRPSFRIVKKVCKYRGGYYKTFLTCGLIKTNPKCCEKNCPLFGGEK